MKEDVIKATLAAICEDSGIGDLDLETFPNVIPKKPHELGMFFIDNDVLYFGETAGNPDFCRLGKIDELQKILYRLYEEDEMIDFIFEFSKYRVIVEHTAFIARGKISIYDRIGEKWVVDKKTSLNAHSVESVINSIENA